MAVRLTVEAFPAAVRSGGRIHVRCDNLVVVHVLRNLTTRSPALMAELRRLVALLARLNCRLTALWLPTAANV